MFIVKETTKKPTYDNKYKKLGAFIAHLGRLFLVMSLLLTLLSGCGDDQATSSPVGLGPTPTPTFNPTAAAWLTVAPTPGPAVKMPDSTLPVVKNGVARVVGPLDASAPVTFTLFLKLNPATAADLQKILGSPTSGDTGFISADDFIQRFAPSEAALKALQEYLAHQGVTTLGVAKNRLSATFQAPAGLLQNAFKVKLNRYREDRPVVERRPPFTGGGQIPPAGSEPGLPPTAGSSGNAGTGTTTPPTTQFEELDFYANDSDLSVPQNYLPYIESIVLNDYPLASSVTTLQNGFSGYVPSQYRAAYNLTGLSQAGFDGNGQTIGIIAAAGFKREDINNFLRSFNLPDAQIEVIPVDGGSSELNDVSVEVTLDLEIALAMAPRAKILLYTSPGLGMREFLNTINTAVAENRTKVISISYGLCEIMADRGSIATYHNIFTQARAQGITLFASSGDAGAFDCVHAQADSPNRLSVSSPASDPFVTAVGGTSLYLQNGQAGQEFVWADPARRDGGGGGVSGYFKLPDYQQGYRLNNFNPNGARQVPDVSGNADPRTGYAIYCSFGQDCNGWFRVGGTSASAPMWAGATAVINQYLEAHLRTGQARVVGPQQFYQLQTLWTQGQLAANPYRDVTQGNNLYYPAGTGYDLAVGLGVPDFSNLALGIEQLYRGKTETPTPTPGQVGGIGTTPAYQTPALTPTLAFTAPARSGLHLCPPDPVEVQKLQDQINKATSQLVKAGLTHTLNEWLSLCNKR
jgi:kumamolisin